MELAFEFEEKIAEGKQGNVFQFPSAYIENVFQNDTNELMSKLTGPENENYSGLTFDDEGKCAKDENTQFIDIKNFMSKGIYGTWLHGDTQKLVIFLIEFDVSKYMEEFSITYDINNPIVSFDLDFPNPNELFTSEDEPGLMDPNVKISFNYSIGDSEIYKIGTFYADNTTYTVLDNNISINGRNLVGKALKDQSFDENNSFTLQTITSMLASILDNAGVAEYSIESTINQLQITFEPDELIYKGIEEILKAIPGWRIEETADGNIVIGSDTFSEFPQRSVYEFVRGNDVRCDLTSREIKRDDREAYTKICVHNSDKTLKIFREVISYKSWRIGANKTLYIEIADGTSTADATAYAEALASKMSNVGTVQNFNGPFRPWILCGDMARITNKDGEQIIIGIITRITHRGGKSGYSTEFVVDSGGVLGIGRMSDYIKRLQTFPKKALREYS